MTIIFNTNDHYILVLKYWDSISGKIAGDKYQYFAYNFKNAFAKFKRLFFDSTFDINYLFIVKNN